MLDIKVNNNFDIYRKIILDDHGIVICPTDTVYGFFASSLSDIAVQKVFKIKQRDFSKKLIINVSDIKVLKDYIQINDIGYLLISKFWPGKLSIIFNLTDSGRRSFSKFIVKDNNTICVRIPNHPQALDLLSCVNIPLISTSVNLSGKNPINSYNEIVNNFKKDVDLILPNDFDLTDKLPSTIIDITDTNNIKIIRQGSILKSDIENTINSRIEFVE